MVKAKTTSTGSRSRPWGLWVLLGLMAAFGAAFWMFREPIQGYAGISTAYSARVACACRFVAGRSLADCSKDKLAGMELVTLADDVPARSVTARFPLMASSTATLRDGYGCVLEPWDG